MKLSQFYYYLPEDLIAQEPQAGRDRCRLLVVNRKDKSINEVVFKDMVNFINEGDLLILNDTRVIAARLNARRKTGGHIEVLLLRQKSPGVWEVLVKPGRKARVGEEIVFGQGEFSAQILQKTSAGGRLLKFTPSDTRDLIARYGSMPLPHYIKKELKRPDYYQTVYAKKEGAVAAPTAGLHFTRQLLNRLESRGVRVACITLHCGLGTFRPVKTQDIQEHIMQEEFYEICPRAAEMINKAKQKGSRIIAVGTTTVRAMEAAALKNNKGIYRIKAGSGQASLYIYPGYRFKIVDTLITNFHLPHSTNLILVSAFSGIRLMRRAYERAIKKAFRFYSFGDAMLVI